MSRIVRGSAELTAAFDGDLDGLLERWRPDVEAPPTPQRFLAAVDDFMYEHGGRGPNEWDVYQRSYETNPTMLLQAIERTRHAGDDADPALSLAAGVAERQRLIDKYEADVRGQRRSARRVPDRGAHASRCGWRPASAIKSSNIRCHNEVRICFDELGRRMVERGHLEHASADLHAPRRGARRLPGRARVRSRRGWPSASRTTSSLYDLEPPYIVNGVVPPLRRMEAPR